jgi:hypothetical protein
MIERILSAAAPEALLRLRRRAHAEGWDLQESPFSGGLVPAYVPRSRMRPDEGPPRVPRR